MLITEFKQRMRDAFGPQMRYATPANVREFLDEIARERWHEEKAARSSEHPDDAAPPLEIRDDGARSYEDILRRFFADSLDAPQEEALIELWLFALDLAYSGVEEQADYEIGGLFLERPARRRPFDRY